MQIKRYVLITWVTILSLLTGASAPRGPALAAAAYVEGGLLSSQDERLSVIVTAEDAQAAARAVVRVGGQVSSELWLVDAVAATVPTS